MEEKYVFISYSSNNKTIADATCHMLEEYGIPCWIAPRNITPGKTWAGNIVQAIRDCSIMVLIYSQDSNSSSQVANEVDRAFNAGKIIIPFMVDSTPMNDDFDYYLSRKHWLVAYPDYREQLMPLVEAVAANMGIRINPKKQNTFTPKASSADAAPAAAESNPKLDKAIEAGKKALLNYEIDTAFAELLRPALLDYKDSRFEIAKTLSSDLRLFKIEEYRFDFVKEKALAGNSFAQYIMAAYYQYGKRNGDECFRFASMSAAQNDSYGIFQLSVCYELGLGTEIDLKRGMELRTKAINMDNFYAIFRQARDIAYGWNKAPDHRAAEKYLRRAMEAGVPNSFVTASVPYSEGLDRPLDIEKARQLIMKDIEQGYIEGYQDLAMTYIFDQGNVNTDKAACAKGIEILHKGIDLGGASCLAFLGSCYQQGWGVPAKPEMAIRWLKQAAEAGDRFSYYSLGSAYYYGQGCKEDEPMAWQYLTKGAAKGEGNCHYLLGVMCLDGYGQEGKERADGFDYLKRAEYILGGSNAEASYLLYKYLRTEELESNPLIQYDDYKDQDWIIKDNEQAMKSLRNAADAGYSPDAIFRYGAILCTENSPYADEFKGMKYLEKASDAGISLADVMLGDIYKAGIIVSQDMDKARQYYQKAADAGCGDGYAAIADLEFAEVLNHPNLATKESVHAAYEKLLEADLAGCKRSPFTSATLRALDFRTDAFTQEEREYIKELKKKYKK